MFKYLPVLVLLVAPAIITAQDTAPPIGATLWQNLRQGMTPSQVAANLNGLPGIKKVKLKKPKQSQPQDFLDLNHTAEGIAIQNGRYELKPEFKNGTLAQVSLVGDQLCANGAMTQYDGFASAMKTKYPVSLDGQSPLTERTVMSLLNEAARSQKNETYVAFFGNDETVVAVAFAFTKELPPRYAGGGNFAYNLWKLAQSLYEGRVQNCSGTRDERMRIVFQYYPKIEFEKMLKETESKMKSVADETTSKL